MNIKQLIKDCHKAAIKKGFYDCPECDEDGDIWDGGYMECPECNGTGINQNRNIGELLMLIVSELSEALEAHRNNRFAFVFETYIKDTFEDEIADVFIRLFDYAGYRKIAIFQDDSKFFENGWDNIGGDLFRVCEQLSKHDISYVYNMLIGFCKFHNIDIEKHIIAKMEYNKTRPYKHGKEY